MIRALILGGTADASLLAAEIARAGIDAVYSYGGRTRAPADQPLATRIGGFGGVSGLADYIRAEGITHVIDATHPFAAEMSRNAVDACTQTGTPLLALERAPWIKASADTWIEVTDVDTAVSALPDAPANVFLAIGRQHIAPFATKPQHAYTLRFVDPPDAPLPFAADVIVSRGPFTLHSELAMMRTRGIAWIVARNSGGDGARAKIDAARMLGLPVIMISRPELPERRRAERVADVMQWLGHSARLGA
ncbi:cobalt-precorrin-6A reductase [Bradyrhizobium sp. NBAIM20]|uniref:cobalt-precorrin-6A reductase n=1 Tax=unclassified Bradyrhizobium TaxID=2631580 RepID=UPI001CD2D7FF|nr:MULTISPECIES: cobalt-precorrin-6A reductase [unclassified Bradyrhizobium]MCA1412551.1 cobalt-precorrin-6A reductase [Bradyrhizobium sp. NBAIM20]MCA1465026.1 cobalt-precorrin-6A reductase [Bradyrhizobium sp. NBAIM18]